MADYDCSLFVLDYMKNNGFITKSGFMLGLGENMDEVKDLIMDLDRIKLDILTIGQYIQPSKQHLKVENQ